MKSLLPALGLVALGFAGGVAADRMWLADPTASVVEHGPAARRQLLDDLQQTVGLTDQQLNDVHRIMARNQVAVSQAWNEVQPRVDAVLDSVWAQIREVLEPDQVEPFHRWFAATHPLPREHAR